MECSKTFLVSGSTSHEGDVVDDGQAIVTAASLSHGLQPFRGGADIGQVIAGQHPLEDQVAVLAERGALGFSQGAERGGGHVGNGHEIDPFRGEDAVDASVCPVSRTLPYPVT